MRFSGNKFLAILASLAVFACGKEQKQETVYDYYIEEGEFQGSNTSADPITSDAKKKDDKRFRFVTPAAALTAAGVVAIAMEFTGTPADATWSVYYATGASSTNGTAIETDLPITQTQVDWDTADVAAGDYYLYAVLKTGEGTGRSNAGVTITVSEAGEGEGEGDGGTPGPNAKPTLALDFPNGENVFVAGAPQAIKFTAADADDDTLKYKIEFSADGGTTWSQVAADVTATTYDWDVAGLAQGINYRVRVTADDGNGGTVQSQSAKSFGVATTPMTFAAGFGAMLTQRCGGCHATGRVNQAQFRSDNFDLATIGVSDKMNNIKGRIEAGTMPTAGPLGNPDKAVLTMWIWGGGQ